MRAPVIGRVSACVAHHPVVLVMVGILLPGTDHGRGHGFESPSGCQRPSAHAASSIQEHNVVSILSAGTGYRFLIQVSLMLFGMIGGLAAVYLLGVLRSIGDGGTTLVAIVCGSLWLQRQRLHTRAGHRPRHSSAVPGLQESECRHARTRGPHRDAVLGRTDWLHGAPSARRGLPTISASISASDRSGR